MIGEGVTGGSNGGPRRALLGKKASSQKHTARKIAPLYELGTVSKILNLQDYPRVCEECGREFVAHRKDKRFCCESCYQSYYYRKHK